MKEREALKLEEYTNLQRHQYKNIHFFTAQYLDHIVLEPVHEEVLKALSDKDTDYERLYSDSAHSWARHMTLDKQRDTLIAQAHDDIDYILSGKSLKEQRAEYLKTRAKLKANLEIFKQFSKGDGE